MKSNRLIIILFSVGLLVRFFLAGATFHSDIASIASADSLLWREKVFNIYDYLQTASKQTPVVQVYGRNFFTYPPLAYFLLGGLRTLFFPFLSKNIFNKLLKGAIGFAGCGFSFDLLVLKLPYLVFDILILFLLQKMFKQQKERFFSFLFWWFNPLVVYTSYMVGQFDVIPVFLAVSSLWAYLKKRNLLAAIFLGLGAGLKMFPLFFLLPLAFFSSKTIFSQLKIATVGIGVYFLTLLPFLSSSAFRQNVLFSNQSQKMLFAKLPVSGAEGIYIFVFLFCLICYFAFYEKNSSIKVLSNYYLFTLLAFFSVTHFHPQWFLWLAPFLIINFIKNNFKTWPMTVIILLCWFGITLLFEPSLSVGLFAPLNKNLFRARGLAEIMPLAFDAFRAKSILRSVLAGSSLFLVLFSFSYAKKKD